MIQDARLRAHIRNLGRHFLHAEKLGITHPKTGERLEFNSPLPANLSELLEALDHE
jgi:23S rRNA pseudouridine1911/1915/1917 synthase